MKNFDRVVVVGLLLSVCWGYSGFYSIDTRDTSCSILSLPPTQLVQTCGSYAIITGLDFDVGTVISSAGNFGIVVPTDTYPVECHGEFINGGSIVTGLCFASQVYCKYQYLQQETCNGYPTIQGIWYQQSTNGTCPSLLFPEYLAIFQCGSHARLMSNYIGGYGVDAQVTSSGKLTFSVDSEDFSCEGQVIYTGPAQTIISGTCTNYCQSFTYVQQSTTC